MRCRFSRCALGRMFAGLIAAFVALVAAIALAAAPAGASPATAAAVHDTAVVGPLSEMAPAASFVDAHRPDFARPPPSTSATWPYARATSSNPAERFGRVSRASLDSWDGFVTPSGATVRHRPLNPGPLADDVANTFRSGTYNAVTSSNPTTLYRVYSDPARQLGPYWTRTRPTGPTQSIIDNALDPAWGNRATNWVEVQVPAGTTFYEGAAAAQRGLVGGGNQVFLPWVDDAWVVRSGGF